MAFDFTDPQFHEPLKTGKNRKRGKRRAANAAFGNFVYPGRSARLYVYIAPSQVHLFRFLLEAHDNLGIMTVVDRWRAALLLRFSPHQERDIREFLEEAGEVLPLQVPPALRTGQA